MENICKDQPGYIANCEYNQNEQEYKKLNDLLFEGMHNNFGHPKPLKAKGITPCR